MAKVSCSTLITYYGGLDFRNLDDLRNGQAVYMDITNKFLQEKGFKVPQVSPYEAGKTLVNISRGFDPTFFEHFITDVAGHSGDYNTAAEVIATLDSFLESVAENMDLQRDILLVSSDHGNPGGYEQQNTYLQPGSRPRDGQAAPKACFRCLPADGILPVFYRRYWGLSTTREHGHRAGNADSPS